MITDGILRDHLPGQHPVDALAQGNKTPGDGGAPRAAIRLQHVAVDDDLVLAQGIQIHHRPQGTSDQALDLLRAAALPAALGLAAHALSGGARQHAIFGRHPAAPQPFHPAGHALLQGGGAQNPRMPHRNQA